MRSKYFFNFKSNRRIGLTRLYNLKKFRISRNFFTFKRSKISVNTIFKHHLKHSFEALLNMFYFKLNQTNFYQPSQHLVNKFYIDKNMHNNLTALLGSLVHAYLQKSANRAFEFKFNINSKINSFYFTYFHILNLTNFKLSNLLSKQLLINRTLARTENSLFTFENNIRADFKKFKSIHYGVDTNPQLNIFKEPRYKRRTRNIFESYEVDPSQIPNYLLKLRTHGVIHYSGIPSGLRTDLKKNFDEQGGLLYARHYTKIVSPVYKQ